MPYFVSDTLKLHYTDSLNHLTNQTSQETIITLHGMSESHLYWSLSGITQALIDAGYRVISMDMRGHGFTENSSSTKGYDVKTLAQDIDDLADHLGLEKFHLLTHATGGIVGFHYAFDHSNRLLSLMSTNTGPATYPSNKYADITDAEAVIPPLSELDAKRNTNLAKTFKGQLKGDLIQNAIKHADKSPFLNNMPKLKHADTAFAQYTACSYIGNPDNIADFVEAFYTSYDPHIKGLRNIQCPTLMLVGEYDHLFIKPAQQVAREVPNCQHVIMQGIGHMTAFEDPEQLIEILMSFLKIETMHAA